MSTPLPPVAQVFRVRVTQALGDDLHIDNIFYCQYGLTFAPLTAAQVLALANQIFAAWHTRIMPMQCNVLTLESVTVTDLHTATGFEATSTTAPVVGSVATQAVTAATSMVVTLRTAVRGRSFRGRLYLAGFPVSQVATAQTWGATATTNAGANMSLLAGDIAILTPVSALMCITSFYSGTDATIPGRRPVPIRRITPVATTITTFLGDQRIGSQRRRNA